MTFTFNKGVHPNSCKRITENLAIIDAFSPESVYIPLAQHIGKPSQCVVEAGDRVKKGQLIGKAADGLSANVFSSVSGTVKGIVSLPNPLGVKIEHIEILNDGKEEEESFPPISSNNKEEILSRIKEAGIVGMGGAAFPTYFKLIPPSGVTVDTLLINGAECEPYITCDYRIMIELSEQFLEGVKLLKTAIGAKTVVIGIENNKKSAIDRLSQFPFVKVITRSRKDIDDEKINVMPLKVKYPQGAEKQLIYAVTKRIVPDGALPSSVGCCVDNVHTALSVYYAVRKGKPLYERIMTVSGKGVKKPCNMWVKVGVPYKTIAEKCEMKEDVQMVVSGGPMMGFSVHSLDVCTTKASSSLLFLEDDEITFDNPTTCIGCGKCASVCPMNLMPNFIDANVLFGNFAAAKRYGALSCIECGSCSFICPANRPLVQSCKLAKKTIREKKI